MVKGRISGFITHPFETSDGQYSAMYGNNAKTDKSFKTLKEAKNYLMKNGIKETMYDAPEGTKIIKLKEKQVVPQKTKRVPNVLNPFDSGFGF